VLLLTRTRATSSTSLTLVAAVGSLAGYALATNKALATLPSTTAVIGTALSIIPACDESSDDRHAAGHDGPSSLVRGHGLRHPVARGGHVPARLLHRRARPALGRAYRHLLGIALNVLAVVAASLDVGVYHFFLAMTLNGIGFMFVAGSALVTKAYAPAERSRTQAANDFLVFGTAAVTSLSSGQLLHHKGWQVVLATAAVMLLLALAGSLWRTSRASSPDLAAAD
jgi:hypothetical protein